MNRFLISVLFAAGLTACATAPLTTDYPIREISPKKVVTESNATGHVIWGGVIVSAHNLADRTQLEVLSYPLNKQQRPLTSKQATGRFLVQSEGYLELTSYEPGRSLTVLGTLQGVTEGTVGEAKYKYPTVTATDLHLWRGDSTSQTGVVFGIGISLGG